jgi:hypothetical protein
MSVVDAARRRESAMKAMPKPAPHARGRRGEAEDRSRRLFCLSCLLRHSLKGPERPTLS